MIAHNSLQGKRKIKILNVLHVGELGGPQIRAISVANKLRFQNIETIFVIPKGKYKFAELARSEGFKVYQVTEVLGDPTTFLGILRNIKYSMMLPISVINISRIIQKEKVDIVHNNTIFNIAGFLAAIITKRKLVWHLNDTMAPKIIKKIMCPLVLKCSDAIVTASKEVARYYFGNKNISNLSIIYAPVNIERFNPRKVSKEYKNLLRKEFDINENDIIIGTVGNISRIKGYEYFIKAAALVKKYVEKKGKKVKFIIVGDVFKTQNKYYNELKELKKNLNLNSDLIFAGFRNDIPEILSIVDIFVFTSLSEGCPIAVLEAMAAGLPIVASKINPVSEIINEKTGILVEPKKPEAIANAIINLLENPGMLNNIEGKKMVTENFSLDICVDKHAHLYRRIINNLNGGR